MGSAMNTARAAIEAALKTAAGTVPVAWPGTDFEPPKGDTGDGRWIRPTIQWGDGRMHTGGSGTTGNRVVGILFLNLFDRQGAGHKRLYTLADTLRDAFTRTTIGGAHFAAPSGPRPGPVETGGDARAWEHVFVTCPFDLGET